MQINARKTCYMLGHMYERPWSVDTHDSYDKYFQEAARLQGLAWKLADWVHLCSRATMLGLFPKMCPCFLPNAIFVNIFAIRLRSHRISDNGPGTPSSLVNKIEDGFRFVFFLQHNHPPRCDSARQLQFCRCFSRRSRDWKTGTAWRRIYYPVSKI